MQKNKHTCGPWQYEGGDNASCEVMIGDTACSITRYHKNTGNFLMSREEMEANAKLIAAAPDLLEALEILLHDYEMCIRGADTQPAYFIAKDAIKKALGE